MFVNVFVMLRMYLRQYWIELDGIGWYEMVLDGIRWYEVAFNTTCYRLNRICSHIANHTAIMLVA